MSRNRLVWPGAIALLLLAAPPAPAAAARAPERAPVAEPDSSDLPPKVTRVPAPTRLKMAEGATHVLIDVMLNGRGPFRLILDTGAATTVLDADLVKELGMKSLGTTRIGDPSNPLANVVDRIEIGSVVVGAAHFEGVTGVGWRGPSLAAAVGARGVLGLPTFHDCLLTIDYPKREVEVAPGELPAVDGRRVLPLTVRPIAELPVDVAGHAALAHLDVGNASSLVCPGSWKDSVSTRGEIRKGVGMRASGPVEFTIATLDGDLRIGEFVEHDPEIRFDDKLDRVNVGYRVLRRFAVTLDQRNGRVRLEPGAVADSAAQDRAAPAEGRRRLGAGLGFRPDGGGEVRLVVPGSPAEAAGLQVGDLILRIDGGPATNPAMMSALAGKDPIRLTVRRGESEIEVVLFGNERTKD